MKCLRLTHVNLRVDRLDLAVPFYRDLLGLQPIHRQDAQGKGAWFRLGETEVHLAEDPAPQPRSKRHFAVLVADLEEALREIRASGAEIDREEAGRFWVRDPAGNRIEVVKKP
jgi:catechol 2,3-dioxygenase-like lactoylglutathione lyase family enzyme